MTVRMEDTVLGGGIANAGPLSGVWLVNISGGRDTHEGAAQFGQLLTGTAAQLVTQDNSTSDGLIESTRNSLWRCRWEVSYRVRARWNGFSTHVRGNALVRAPIGGSTQSIVEMFDTHTVEECTAGAEWNLKWRGQFEKSLLNSNSFMSTDQINIGGGFNNYRICEPFEWSMFFAFFTTAGRDFEIRNSAYYDVPGVTAEVRKIP